MQNVVAITALARQGILAAQATSDESLLESIADGNKAAMHVFYARHNVLIYRFVLRIVRNATMADDLVSQVFLEVWRACCPFKGRSRASTWLLSIARFKALSALNQRRRQDGNQEGMPDIADEADTAEILMDRSDANAILRACIAQLSTTHREIIDLVYYHEKSMEEASEIIGIPQSTAGNRMFYARKQLAKLLRDACIESIAA